MRLVTKAGALALTGALLLAGCGGASDQASPDGAPEPLRVAYASDLDPNDIADQIGIEASGAEVTALTEDSAVTAGLINGDYDIGNIDITAAIKAIQAGVPIKIVYVSQNLPEFVMVAQSDISNISQLPGRTVAYHSPGSLTEILQRELIKQTDPAIEGQVKWTVLPESPNRAAAMVAGQIDATTLEYLDVLALQKQGSFNILGDWGDLTGTSADAIATGWVVSEEYLAANEPRVVEFLKHVQAGYDTAYSDKTAWTTLAERLLPDADPAELSLAYDYYVEVGMYPRSGTQPLTQERWTGLDGFFRQIGEYDQEAPSSMVDLAIANEING
jgi:ABC-type nitrate/sulfonate/bicarbonate transport system substrate-binding protein